MLRRVALVRRDVSEERIAPIIRVARIGVLGETLTVTSKWGTMRKSTHLLVTAKVAPRSPILVTLIMGTMRFS
jgi:hypothetical protein